MSDQLQKTRVVRVILRWAVGYLCLSAPGGIGVREGVIVLALAPWATTGVAVGVSLLARLCQLAVIFGIASIGWMVYHSTKKRQYIMSGRGEGLLL